MGLKAYPGLIFTSKDDTETILAAMKDVLKRYSSVSVEDLNDLSGLPSTHEDHKTGWTNLDSARIQKDPTGYLLVLPQLEEI